MGKSDKLMNIFILSTGRCGSTSFIKASQHIDNYSAAHESRSTCIGQDRLDYPSNHIEADNRLSWFLGKIDKKYGDQAFYVHLTRDTSQTVASFSKRENFGIMQAYKEGILLGGDKAQTTNEIALDYIETVESNKVTFQKHKSNKMKFNFESAKEDFQQFWERIGAEGDFEKALLEWDVMHNASD